MSHLVAIRQAAQVGVERQHIEPFFGSTRLSKLTVPAVRAFEGDLRANNRSPALTRKVLSSSPPASTDLQPMKRWVRLLSRSMPLTLGIPRRRRTEREVAGRNSVTPAGGRIALPPAADAYLRRSGFFVAWAPSSPTHRSVDSPCTTRFERCARTAASGALRPYASAYSHACRDQGHPNGRYGLPAGILRHGCACRLACIRAAGVAMAGCGLGSRHRESLSARRCVVRH